MPEDGTSLNTVDDDILITIFRYLSVPGILCLRQTSKRLAEISKLRIVWRNACIIDVIPRGYPFSNLPLNTLPDLEHASRSAYRLGQKWLSQTPEPHTARVFDASPSTHIEMVKFLPGKNWLLTVSKGIWSVITVWDLGGSISKLTEWSPKGAIFNGVAVDEDVSSNPTIAVFVPNLSGSISIILELRFQEGGVVLKTIASWPSRMRPVALKGDVLASSDDMTQTEIRNWKNGASAVMCHPAHPGDSAWQLDRCIQVIFAFKSVLVVRARSIHIFPEPKLGVPASSYVPLARHSFGWVDGVSVSTAPCPNPPHLGNTPRHDPIYILLRAESGDPWSQDEHNLRFFTLHPNPYYQDQDQDQDGGEGLPVSPYLFPPSLTAEVFSSHGSLRCADIKLQPYGTAVWVHPRNRALRGLIVSDVHLQQITVPEALASNERLLVAVFPGPLNRSQCSKVEAKTLSTNENNDWTCLDYNEEGRIALGSSSGSVTILEM